MTSISGDSAPDVGPLSEDVFFDGKLRVAQPVTGFRSGTDALFLAAAVPTGGTLLELGCGAGVAMLAAAVRVPRMRVTGVEVQAGYATLARQNAARNGIDAEVFTADLSDLPVALRARRFDHVIANPPYHPPGSGKPATDRGRDLAQAGGPPLAVWLDVASRRLAPGGTLVLIQRIDRLREVLTGLSPSLGTVVVLPLAARNGRAPDRFVLWAKKGGRGAFRLAAPFVVHAGVVHRQNRPDYGAEAEAILRHATRLPIPR